MKRKMMLCGLVLVLGLFALGCGGDPAGGGGITGGGEDPNAYNGTIWDRTDFTLPAYERLVFTSNSAVRFEMSDDDPISATYVVDGNNVTVSIGGQSTTGAVTGGTTMTFPGNGGSQQVYLKRGPLVGTWKMGEVTLTFHDAYHYTVMVDADTGTRGTYTAMTTTFTLTPAEMTDTGPGNWVPATGNAADPLGGTISSATKITITGQGDFTKQ